MGGILRWHLLIWRYIAAMVLLPFMVALLLSVLLRPPEMAVWVLLALLWPVAFIAGHATCGGRRIRAELAASGVLLGCAMVLVPLCLSAPLLLVPFALVAVCLILLGLWLAIGMALAHGAGPERKRRSLSAAICLSLPADRVMAEMRLVPGQETALHCCGPERDDGWFEVMRKRPDLRHDAMPQRRAGPWPLWPQIAALLPWDATTLDVTQARPGRQYARIVEEGRYDQTVAFSDGDGVSLSLLRVCVTPRLHGCVLRETGWTNTMTYLDWACARLQNHGLWSLAARLDHIAGWPAQYAVTDGPEHPPRPAHRKQAGAWQTGAVSLAKLRKKAQKLVPRTEMLRSRQWR